MTKLYYQAMRSLPEDFVDSETKAIGDDDCVFAMNPKFQPIIYTKESCKWVKWEPEYPKFDEWPVKIPNFGLLP